MKILSAKGERDLIGHVNLKKFKIGARILYLHAREAITELENGTGDICVSGMDLLKDSDPNIQKNTNMGLEILYVFHLKT